MNRLPGPSTTASAEPIAAIASGQALGLRGHQVDGDDPTGSGRDRDLAADLAGAGHRPVRSFVGDFGNDVHGPLAHRQHPTGGVQERSGPVERGYGSALDLRERGEDEIADCMPGQWTAAAKAILEQPRPVVLIGQGSQRHPQIPRRQSAELGAQPAGGAPVVSHGDDRRQGTRHLAQRGE